MESSVVSRREDTKKSACADAVVVSSAMRRRLACVAALLAGLALESLAQQAFVQGVRWGAAPWRAEFRQRLAAKVALLEGVVAPPWQAAGDSVLLQKAARVAAGRPGAPTRHSPSVGGGGGGGGARATEHQGPQPALLTAAASRAPTLDAWERDYLEDDGNPLPEPVKSRRTTGVRPELQPEDEYSENYPRDDDDETNTLVSNGKAQELAAATHTESASPGGSQNQVERAQSKLRAAEQALEVARAKENATHSELERITQSLSDSQAKPTGDSALANAASHREELGKRVSELAIELRRTMADLEKAQRDYDRATVNTKKKHKTTQGSMQNATEARERLEAAKDAEDSASQAVTAAVSKLSDAERELQEAKSNSHATRLARFPAFALLLVAFVGGTWCV